VIIPAERNYHSNELEMLAIVYACEKFQQFILGITTVVITDNSAAVTAFKSKFESKNPRIERWINRVKAKFDLVIKHTAGKLNTIADFFSRYGHESDLEPMREIDEAHDKDEYVVGFLKSERHGLHRVWNVETRRQVRWRKETEKEKQKTEEDLRNILEKCEEGSGEPECPTFSDKGEKVDFGQPVEISVSLGSKRDEWIKEVGTEFAGPVNWYKYRKLDDTTVKASFTHFILQGGVLYHKNQDGIPLLVVPESQRNGIMKTHHDGSCGAHFGLKKFYEYMRSNYWWPTL
jgi:hypothetical protein